MPPSEAEALLLTPCYALALSLARAPASQMQRVLARQARLLQCLHGATWSLLLRRDHAWRESARLQGHLAHCSELPRGTIPGEGGGELEVARLRGLLDGAWASQVLLR